jgi:hypothetical protein
MPRLALVCLAVVAALTASGCGNKEATVTVAETEGIYVTVDDLKYQIQLSRILNPALPEDSHFLRGLPPGEELEAEEVWYGIFMRVENDVEEPHATAENFKITDTQGAEFEPIDVDPQTNDFVYEPTELLPGTIGPEVDTPGYYNPSRGGLILFKVTSASFSNRPLILEVESPTGGENAEIHIDV